MATDNIALVRRLVDEVWNKGNLNVLGELVSEKHVGNHPLMGTVRGLDAFKQRVQTFRAAFPDLKITIDDVGTAGDRVFLRWTGRATHRGTFMGVPPSNNVGEVRGITLHRIAEGKIVEDHESFDALGLMQIMGVVPPMDMLMKGGQARQPQMPRA